MYIDFDSGDGGGDSTNKHTLLTAAAADERSPHAEGFRAAQFACQRVCRFLSHVRQHALICDAHAATRIGGAIGGSVAAQGIVEWAKPGGALDALYCFTGAGGEPLTGRLALEHSLRGRWPWQSRPNATAASSAEQAAAEKLPSPLPGISACGGGGGGGDGWWSEAGWAALTHTFGSTMSLRAPHSAAAVTAVGDVAWLGSCFAAHDHVSSTTFGSVWHHMYACITVALPATLGECSSVHVRASPYFI
jgi:hypothetical protein